VRSAGQIGNFGRSPTGFVRWGIRLDEPTNGVYLPRDATAKSDNGHARLIHPKCRTYYIGVNDLLGISRDISVALPLTNRKAVLDKIQTLKLKLIDGTGNLITNPARNCVPNGGDASTPENTQETTDEDHD
jgi:hypothetical protein